MDYARDIDFTRPFFWQLKELFEVVPQMGLSVLSLENSDYCNLSSALKNCYLVFNSDYSENCMYDTFLQRSKECVDLYIADLCERCYDSSNIFKDYDVRYSKRCNECMNVSFSENLTNCSDCFGCINLKNKQYYIFNQPYSKEEYEKKMSEYDLGSYAFVESMKKRMQAMLIRYPRRYCEGLNNENTIGDYIFNSKNAFYCGEVGDCENCKWCNLLSIASTKDSYDFTMWGAGSEMLYECIASGEGVYHTLFSFNTWGAQTEIEYSKDIMKGGDNLFGCAGLKKKQWCILNKQYSESDYHTLRKQIIEHMNSAPYIDTHGHTYCYGEFFPTELAQHAYNETLAHAFFPLNKTKAIQHGYRWRDVDSKKYERLVTSEILTDHIKNVPDTITKKIIECRHRGTCNDQCLGAFKITVQELAFYRTMNIPLPRLCHNCRHYQRLRNRNSLSKLWPRQCQCGGTTSTNSVYTNIAQHGHGASPCQTEFQTSYSPEKPDIVYCEECYRSEVV